MRLYNTLTKHVEPIKKTRFKKIGLFTCGPTVYDHVHVGNYRTYTALDMLVRYMRAKGYKIRYVQNITDVDDKIIAKAKKEGVSFRAVAHHFEDLFYKTQHELNIESVDTYARATDYVKEIVDQIRRLIRKGYVYEIQSSNAEEGGWYFDIGKFEGYGKLANRTVEQAEDGVSRIDENSKKRNRGDFAVWKFASKKKDKSEPAWDCELGVGRPGWHIEDTAISEKFFGPQYYLHGGGTDLIFPHHEAEIALQEAGSGKAPFVKHWVHAGMLLSGGEKMSKSKGNFIRMDEFLKHHTANAFRFLVLSSHYRATLEFTPSTISQAEKNLQSIALTLEKLKLVKNGKGKELDVHQAAKECMSALEDDFNSPKALAVVFGLINEANKHLTDLSKKSASEVIAFIVEFFDVLGFRHLIGQPTKEAQDLLSQRKLSRDSKQFDKSDALREKIESLGYIVEDSALGQVAIRKQI
ncbi:MAG: cysteine--tRNA ligase [Candidatus Paceibacterota bacterium]